MTNKAESDEIVDTMPKDRKIKQPGRLEEFLPQHIVFRVDEVDRFLSDRGPVNLNTRRSLLTYYLNKGRIIRLRQGMYAVVPFGSSPESIPVDPYIVAAKITADAVLAYHTALEFHGKAHSVHTTLHYVSAISSIPFKFQSYEIKRVYPPRALRAKGKEMFGITDHKRSGMGVRVTSLERTLVDVLDRPDLAGSWEEIWRSLESVEYFDLDQVVLYVRLLDNATTVAKVGFFLEQHRDTLRVDDAHLVSLRKLRPRQPHYLQRNKRMGCRWIKDWNLMVPPEILNRTWGEV